MSNFQREIAFWVLISGAIGAGLFSNITSGDNEMVITLILRTLFVLLAFSACHVENVREQPDIRSPETLVVANRIGEAVE